MFKGSLACVILIWVIVVIISVWLLHAPSLEAQKDYQSLMSGGHRVQQEVREEMRPIQQTRDQVMKQIFYKKDQDRLQSRLMSEHSDLIFKSTEDGTELVERFKGITCLMQEKFVENPEHQQSKQYLRFLKADEAFYLYKSGQLEAQEVEMAHYLIPEHLWPNSLDHLTPLLQGHAQNFQVSLYQEPTLKAEKFQAIFHGWGDE